MLEGLATWVIVGHSERRRDAGETDALVGQKVLRAHEAGLRVILCVGEQLADREAGRAEVVVRTQVRGSLEGVDPTELAPLLTIAYEPVWAIGTGRNAQGSDAAAMAQVIRDTLGSLGFADRGEGIPVLYGGSVSSSNIDEFMAEPAIDGALVGGASLKPDEMAGDRRPRRPHRASPRRALTHPRHAAATDRPRRSSTASGSAATRRPMRSPRRGCRSGGRSWRAGRTRSWRHPPRRSGCRPARWATPRSAT